MIPVKFVLHNQWEIDGTVYTLPSIGSVIKVRWNDEYNSYKVVDIEHFIDLDLQNNEGHYIELKLEKL